MTAINAFAGGRIGYLLTDTAGYDANAVYRGEIDKVAVIPELRMAVAARGHQEACRWFADEIEVRFETFDDFVIGGQSALAEFYGEAADDLAASGTADVDLVIAGWSQSRQEMELYLLSSFDHRTRGGNIAPFALVKHPYAIAPMVADYLTARGIMAQGSLLGRPKDVLFAAIDGQRVQKHETSFTDEPVYLVGGRAVLTTITPDGIQQETVRRWSDTIGELINPGEQALVTANVLNRQQRRAMKAGKRRAA